MDEKVCSFESSIVGKMTIIMPMKHVRQHMMWDLGGSCLLTMVSNIYMRIPLVLKRITKVEMGTYFMDMKRNMIAMSSKVFRISKGVTWGGIMRFFLILRRIRDMRRMIKDL